MNSPLIYEVHIELPEEIYSDYRQWLFEHVEEMCALSYFQKAKIFEVQDLSDEPGRTRHLKVHYFMSGHGTLDEYLKNAAPALRDRLPQRFRSSLRFSRYALTPCRQ